MTTDEIAAAVKAGHADVVDLWAAVQQFAAQRSGKWLRLGRGGVTFDDLQQEAFIAMIQALEGWDPDAGAFLTWYGFWIKNAFTVACSLRSARGQRAPLEMAVSLDTPVSENPDGETLVDIAERRYVNNINLTSQAPVINVNGQNTGNTPADRQNLANALRDILVQQVAAGSVQTTAKAF